MNIAILSGKGGTGKTTVSINLAIALQANYIDCDVEEPNGFLFLKPYIEVTKDVFVEYPMIDETKCNNCGKCINACQFNALAKVKEDTIIFEKLCHSCGACKIVCEAQALNYSKRKIGVIEEGKVGKVKCYRGILDVGEPMATSIINDLLKDKTEGINIIDCPPGTSCNVVNALKYSNCAILVTEPTEFGLHDMKMAISVIKKFNIPFGVIINKEDTVDNLIRKFCYEKNINIISSIPYNKEIAIEYSKGHILYDNLKYKKVFDYISINSKEALQWN